MIVADTNVLSEEMKPLPAAPVLARAMVYGITALAPRPSAPEDASG